MKPETYWAISIILILIGLLFGIFGIIIFISQILNPAQLPLKIGGLPLAEPNIFTIMSSIFFLAISLVGFAFFVTKKKIGYQIIFLGSILSVLYSLISFILQYLFNLLFPKTFTMIAGEIVPIISPSIGEIISGFFLLLILQIIFIIIFAMIPLLIIFKSRQVFNVKNILN